MNTHSLWPSLGKRRKIELETEVSECGTFHMIAVRGRLTIETAPDLLEEFRRTMRRADRIKVNLQAVDFLDSSNYTIARFHDSTIPPTTITRFTNLDSQTFYFGQTHLLLLFPTFTLKHESRITKSCSQKPVNTQ